MERRRRPLRGRDVISLGRKIPRCNFVEIRDELRSIQADLIELKIKQGPVSFYKSTAVNCGSEDREG